MAERLLRTPPPLLSRAAFHAQPAGENAFNAFLAAHDVSFRATRNLEDLLNECQAIDARFEQLGLAARTLTPYATRFCYPRGPLAPTSVEAEEALQLADDVVQFVRARLRPGAGWSQPGRDARSLQLQRPDFGRSYVRASLARATPGTCGCPSCCRRVSSSPHSSRYST